MKRWIAKALAVASGFLLIGLPLAYAFQPTLAFWQIGAKIFAVIDSSDLVPQISNDLRTRSVTISGYSISEYKAIVINSGTCSDAANQSALLSAPTSSFSVPFTFTPDSGQVDAFYTVCAIGKTYAGVWQSVSTPTASYTLRVNQELPQVTFFGLNNGTSPTPKARIPVQFTASHSVLNVTHFCLKTRLSSVAPATPDKNDSCWYAVNNPSPGKTPAPTVTFNNFSYNLGFSTADYYVYAWAKAESGAVSYLTSLGNGSDGVDKAMIHFDQSLPPVVINASSTSTDSPANPVTRADLIIPAGSSVVVKWAASDDFPLPSNPISLSYTTDDANYIPIASNLVNGVNGACTIDASHTGCYVWTNGSPTSGYFKVRVIATDSSSLTGAGTSPANNTSPMQILAGNTDPGLGTSASSAVIFPKLANVSNTENNAGCFVVTDEGVMYIVDRRGLAVIDPNDGIYRILLNVTGTVTTGPVASASLSRLPRKLALDYSKGLLIYDTDRILRLDLTTNTLSTFIGGGSTSADGTLASNYLLTPSAAGDNSLTLMPLPNGDVWFTSGLSIGRARNGSHLEVYTASDQKIHWKTPVGTGSLENASYDPSAQYVRNYGFAFNPTNSAITKIRAVSTVPYPGGQVVYSLGYNPVTFSTTTGIPFVSYWAGDPTITTALGEMYSLDRFTSPGLFKYNSSTNAWDRIIGNGTNGQCPDGTLATACSIDIFDAFISAQGIIYIVDRNRIRTVDANGKMLTLFGQALSFGDGGLATSARISQITWFHRGTDGKYVVVDDMEYRIREVTPGNNIDLLAGTGTDQSPDTTNPAVGQPVSVKYWGGSFPFTIDTNDNGILYWRGGTIAKLSRSTGKWSDVAGGGGTSYTQGDGVAPSSITFNGYSTGPNGFNGSRYLVHMHQWDGTASINSYLKSYQGDGGGVQQPLAGKSGPIAGDFADLNNAPAGDSASNYALPSNFGTFSNIEWDPANSQWLLHAVGWGQIKPVAPDGTIGALIAIPRGFFGFKKVVKSGTPFIYYCANDGAVYKYNLTTSTETALARPTSTIWCNGFSLEWDSARNSVVFSFTQNGLGGIAEIYDP